MLILFPTLSKSSKSKSCLFYKLNVFERKSSTKYLSFVHIIFPYKNILDLFYVN